MKRMLRRKRARLKALLYLALFGPGEDTDDTTDDFPSDTDRTGDTNDEQTPEE